MSDLDITQANRIPLPGGWADLRPTCDITERMRRPIKKLSAKLSSYPQFMAAVTEADASMKGGAELTQAEQLQIAASMGEAFDVLEELQDRLVVAAVRGWSFDLPVDAESILDLPTAALDALREAASPYQSALNPDFSPTPEADSPTGPSSG